MGSQSAFGMICMLHSVIKTSDSFSGVLLVTIVFILFRVSFVKDKDFQAFFAEGCTLLCIVMAFWRGSFERKSRTLPAIGFTKASGTPSWREKYD
ncbi:hypothetical protein HN51_037244 [Arachis hypogaea]